MLGDRSGWLLQLLCLALPALGVILVVLTQDVIPPVLAFHDPVSIQTPTGSEYCCLGYYGGISSLGVMLWTSAAAVCLFSGLLLVSGEGFTAKACALIAGGALTGVLAVDDLFLLHDDLFKFHGIDEKFTFAVYGVGILSYLFAFRAVLLKGNVILLALSLAFFGISTVTDVFQHLGSHGLVLIEEITKFLGIVFWAGFHVFFATQMLSGTQKDAAV